jgi:hypothetical protein
MRRIFNKNLMEVSAGNNTSGAYSYHYSNQKGSILAQAVFVRIFQADHIKT